MALPLAVEAALAPNEVRRAPIGPGLLDAKHGHGPGPPLPPQAALLVHGRTGPGLCARVAVFRCRSALVPCWSRSSDP